MCGYMAALRVGSQVNTVNIMPYEAELYRLPHAFTAHYQCVLNMLSATIHCVLNMLSATI